ncbi:MAG: hypothetical protein M1839_001901 [Geoglossum umbratile]|nr:MAG: hypothetical protein M1839_001901 [Geoglossum umbratile]
MRATSFVTVVGSSFISQPISTGFASSKLHRQAKIPRDNARQFARSYKRTAQWRKDMWIVHDVVKVTPVTSMSTFVPALVRSQRARAAEGSTPGFEIIVAQIRSQNVRIAESSTQDFETVVAPIRSQNVRIAEGSILGSLPKTLFTSPSTMPSNTAMLLCMFVRILAAAHPESPTPLLSADSIKSGRRDGGALS